MDYILKLTNILSLFNSRLLPLLTELRPHKNGYNLISFIYTDLKIYVVVAVLYKPVSDTWVKVPVSFHKITLVKVKLSSKYFTSMNVLKNLIYFVLKF